MEKGILERRLRQDIPRTHPRKVLHDMARKGLSEHLGYERDRVWSAADYVRARNDIDTGYELFRGEEEA